jgi:uncharacterized membrane protein
VSLAVIAMGSVSSAEAGAHTGAKESSDPASASGEAKRRVLTASPIVVQWRDEQWRETRAMSEDIDAKRGPSAPAPARAVPPKHIHAPGTVRDTGRMEAFSDGVFAIAITLLVININVPPAGGAGEPVDLRAALLGLWPSYVGYVFSFVTIGIYWVNHHYTGKLYVKVDHVFNLANLLFLMSISFLPFPTRVFAEHIVDLANRPTAVRFYVFGLVLPAAGWLLKWLYATGRGRLIDPHLDRTFVRRLTIQYARTFALYVIAALLTFVDVWVGLALAVGLTLLYLLPPPQPVYVRPGSWNRSKEAPFAQ